MTEAMNDRCMIDLNTEIALFEIWMSDMKRIMLRQEMRYEDLRLFMFDKQHVEIEIEKKKMQLKIDKIKIEIVKLHELSMKTKVCEFPESIPSVQQSKKRKVIGFNDNYNHHLKLLSETMPLVVEKIKEIGFNNDHHHHVPLVMERMMKMQDRFFSNDHHPDLKLMNTELKYNIEKLKLLKNDIYQMERWIDDMKMARMKIKDITEPDLELKPHVLQFNDEESSDNELETYNYNQEKIDSFEMKLISIQRQINRQVAEKKQMKVNGLDYAKIAGLRAISQYWRLPLIEPKEQLRGVYWKKLELPNKGGLCGWDEVEKWPLAVQIYSLKLTCCSDDHQDYAVDASGVIYLLIGNGIAEPSPYIIHVKPQTLTKKDPYLLLDDPTYIPLLFPACPPPMIHVKLLLRRRDEPHKLTRSMEVVEDANLGTGKHYMLKLTHGIVVNTIVANISVHLHPSLWDSWDGKFKITASDRRNPCKHAVLANYKKVPVTIDYENSCVQLLRPRICVDFFGVLEFYIECFGTNACLEFIPRDCYSHDNCERKEALKGIRIQVKWSTS